MTLVLGFAAVNTGNNLLFLIVAAQLGFMAVSGVIGWLNIRRLRVRFSVPDEVYSGNETLVSVHIQNKWKFLPSFLIRVHLLGTWVDFPVTGKGGSSSAPVAAKFRERGWGRIDSAWISSIFPINFFIRFRPCPPSDRFLVFPQPLPVAPPGSAGKWRDGSTESLIRGYEGDVAKIGEYTGTEPQKLIHWKLSARHENLKVKEMTAVASEPVIIDVDSWSGADVESRVSGATYLVNRLIRQNRPVGLKISGRVIPAASSRAHRLRLLGELAVYGQD